MKLPKTIKTAILAGALAVPIAANAQESEAEIAVGTTYLVETYTDWQLACDKTETGADPCRIIQNVANNVGSTLARVSIETYTDPSKGIAAGARITVPLLTSLAEGLRLQIDEHPAKQYPFAYCDTVGCYALLGFTLEELGWLKNGNSVTLVSVPFGGAREPAVMQVSLSGITSAYDALVEQELKNLSGQ